MPEISGPDFVTLLVRDLETSHAFYKEKIGLPESSEKPPNAYAFATKPCGLAVRQSTNVGTTAHPGHGIIVWFRASDATAAYHRLKEHGVPIVEDLRKGPFGMTFSFKDPDGYILTVHDGG